MKIKKRKTYKSFSKRFKKTNNVILRKCCNKGHLLRKKNSKQKRKLSRTNTVNNTQFKTLLNLI